MVTQLVNEQNRRSEQAGQDATNIQFKQAEVMSLLFMQLWKHLQRNPSLQQQLKMDVSQPMKLTFKVGSETAWEGTYDPKNRENPVKVSQENLQHLDKIKGIVPFVEATEGSEVNCPDCALKINGKSLFEVKDGKVITNQLPEQLKMTLKNLFPPELTVSVDEKEPVLSQIETAKQQETVLNQVDSYQDTEQVNLLRSQASRLLAINGQNVEKNGEELRTLGDGKDGFFLNQATHSYYFFQNDQKVAQITQDGFLQITPEGTLEKVTEQVNQWENSIQSEIPPEPDPIEPDSSDSMELD